MVQDLGRHLYGAAAIIFGAATIFWYDFNIWQGIAVLGKGPYAEPMVYVAAVAVLAGGLAIPWRGTAGSVPSCWEPSIFWSPCCGYPGIARGAVV